MATGVAYDRPHLTTGGYYNTQHQQQSTSKTLAIVGLLPVGGILLGLAGLTFIGTLIGLAVATPLFIIFSPIIVPAVLTIGLAVAGFLTSGTFGLTGLSSLSYLFNMVRQSAGSVPEAIQDVGDYAGQKTKEFGKKMQSAGHEIGEHGQAHGQAGVGVNVQVGGGKKDRT
ncbi:oleosin-like [Bidens hawaiensis]|uniref:oleosin-like n=1 Tax=Bidens hawaiensis TaxID=980011 RepID=UPI00404A8144